MAEEMLCPGGQVHVVREGETMWRLARRYGVSLDALIAANPQIEDPSEIEVGDRICIPAVGEECPGFMYEIRRGDTFYRLATRFNTTVSALMRYNPDVDPERLQIGQMICVPVRPPEIEGFRALLLMPGEMAPEAQGVAVLNFDRNLVWVIADDLPHPGEFEDLETYKLWLRHYQTREWAVAEMEDLCDETWVGRLRLDYPLESYDLLRVTAEMEENEERPVGVTVLAGNIARIYMRR